LSNVAKVPCRNSEEDPAGFQISAMATFLQ